MLTFGVESGSQRIIDVIRKGYKVEVAVRNLAACHRAGIWTVINIIVGVPTETEEDFQKTLDFLRENRQHIDSIMVLASFEIFHHTEMALHPERYQIPTDQVRDLDVVYGIVDWSDKTGNTYEVRQERLRRVRALLAEIGLVEAVLPSERIAYLADLERRREIDPLHELLQDPDPRIRGAATVALGRIGDPRSLLRLHSALEQEAFGQLPGEIQESLVGLRALSAEITARVSHLERRGEVDTLHALLNGSDPWTQHQATAALGRLADPRSVQWLSEVLADEAFERLSPDLQHEMRGLREVYLQGKREDAS